MDGDRFAAGDVIEHRGGIAQVGVPRVEMGVGAVAVAAVIPGDGAPAGVGEQWREESNVRPKSNPPWASISGGSVGLAPLVNGDLHTVGVDGHATVGFACAGGTLVWPPGAA